MRLNFGILFQISQFNQVNFIIQFNFVLQLLIRLEQETGIFFDMKHFEDIVLGGCWEEAEKYLSYFTGVDDNKYSIKIYFEIRKQKFLEALDR